MGVCNSALGDLTACKIKVILFFIADTMYHPSLFTILNAFKVFSILFMLWIPTNSFSVANTGSEKDPIICYYK